MGSNLSVFASVCPGSIDTNPNSPETYKTLKDWYVATNTPRYSKMKSNYQKD